MTPHCYYCAAPTTGERLCAWCTALMGRANRGLTCENGGAMRYARGTKNGPGRCVNTVTPGPRRSDKGTD